MFSIFVLIVIWIGVIGTMIYVKSNSPEPSNQIKPDPTIINVDPSKTVDEMDQDGIPDSTGPNSSVSFDIKDQNLAKPEERSQESTKTKTQSDSKVPIRLPSGQTAPTTNQTGQPNTLDYPQLNIKAPIQFASLVDLFEKNNDGTVDTTRQIQEAPNDKTHLSTPAQKLLTKGIVHLGFTPLPGEFGNSYIVGHSSNYANVVSQYNYIFKDLKNAKSGDLFTIYNKDGKGMTFKVFENIVVNDSDVDKAYEQFNNKRVVTLQASVLVKVNGNLLPLKRQLVRGELVN